MPPELMAIGDSLGNGVRSLTINSGLAAHSCAVRWAARAGQLGIHHTRLPETHAGGF